MAQTRDFEKNPIDINNPEDVYYLVKVVVSSKIKKSFFKRWSFDALVSEGWIQIQTLIKSYDPSSNVPFDRYCFKYLGRRISDGMSSFEEGMVRDWSKDAENRYKHRAHQFLDSSDLSNECNNLYTEDKTSESGFALSLTERIKDCCQLTEKEVEIINLIKSGIPFRVIGPHIGVSESRISQICKDIRRKLYE